MSTRTLYCLFFCLFATNIAILGFALVQSQHIKALEARQHPAQVLPRRTEPALPYLHKTQKHCTINGKTMTTNIVTLTKSIVGKGVHFSDALTNATRNADLCRQNRIVDSSVTWKIKAVKGSTGGLTYGDTVTVELEATYLVAMYFCSSDDACQPDLPLSAYLPKQTLTSQPKLNR